MLNNKSILIILISFFLATPIMVIFAKPSYSQSAPIKLEKNASQQMDPEYQGSNPVLEQKFSQEQAASYAKIERLEVLIENQKSTIQALELQVRFLIDKSLTSGATFEVWSGILLASVAVMVTVLSVMLAFFQYSGIKNAINEARQVASEITPKVAEEKFIEHINNGGFNEIIKKMVDKIAFSNINDPENYIEGARDE